MRRLGERGAAAARGGGVVLLGLIAWNVGNYGFFLVAGRVLGPSDYGLVAALLAATLVVAVPAQSLQFAAARLLAAPPRGDAAIAEGIYERARRRCAVFTAGAALAAAAVIVAAGATGHTHRVGPLLATVAIIVPLGFFFLALGHIQGEQRFERFALCFALWGVPRPLVLLVLAALGGGIYAALGATGAAVVAALAAATMLSHRLPALPPGSDEWRGFIRPLVPVVVGLSGLGVLTNLDVVAAKLSLGPHASGGFAATATLAKTVFLVPQAVSFVLLPRVAARYAAAESTGALLALGVGLTLSVGAVASLVLWAIASPLVLVTYGADYTGSAHLLGLYAAASTLVGALIVVINHHVGRRGDRFVWATGLIALAQIFVLIPFHGSARTIIAVDALTAAAGLLVHECLFAGSGDSIIRSIAAAVRPRDVTDETGVPR